MDAAIRRLLPRYLEGLHFQKSAVAAALEALGGEDSDVRQGALEALRRIAHRLHGTAGMYGLHELGEAAARVERASPETAAAAADRLLDRLSQAVATRGESAATLLIVEDDPSAADVYRTALAAPGRMVHWARTGREAQDLLAQHPVRLVLLDLGLPDVDGRNLLLKLKSRPDTADISVVVATGLTGDLVRQECRALGADAFLHKPIKLAELVEAVGSLLQERAPNPGGPPPDALSGLRNQTALIGEYGKLMEAASALALPSSLGMLRFFPVDDSDADIAELEEVVHRAMSEVQERLRTPDRAARWTTDRMVVLFPFTEASGAMSALGRLRNELAELRLPGLNGGKRRASFAASVVPVAHSMTLEEAVEDARRSLELAAPREGRGQTRAPASASQEPASYSILLVEDDPVTAALVQDRLENEGYRVLHAFDGLAGLEALRRGTFDLALVDLQMPRMDGFEMLSELRAGTAAAPPVVIISALGNEEDIERGFALGAQDYVVKPFSPAELAARVRRLLAQSVES